MHGQLWLKVMPLYNIKKIKFNFKQITNSLEVSNIDMEHTLSSQEIDSCMHHDYESLFNF